MAKKKAAASKAKGKSLVSKAKGTKAPTGSGADFQEQDPKRRLGNFGGKGEHPRQGGRTSGIVGQSKSRNKTAKGPKKK